MSQPTDSSNQTARRERLLIIGLIAIGLVLVLLFGFRAMRSYLRPDLSAGHLQL